MSGAGDQWGPWIDHDGKGCPVPVGTVIEAECHNGKWGNIESDVFHLRAGSGLRSVENPIWHEVHPEHGPAVIRYRIRRPRGLQILDAVLTSLPAAPELEGV